MDSIKEIAISKIAEILTNNNNIIKLENDIWKKIFYSCGLSEYYDEARTCLCMRHYEENWKVYYKHNERSYSKIRELLMIFIDESNTFNKFMSEIVSRIQINDILDYGRVDYSTVACKLEKHNYEVNSDLLMECTTKDFQDLKSNLNLLTLDISIDETYVEKLKLDSFTGLGEEEQVNKGLIHNWLQVKYPKILDSYEKAIKAYSNSDETGCLSHCRSVVTGIFSYSKEEQTDWPKGLQEACKKDKNIGSITNVKSIPKIQYNAHSPNTHERYQYPRFKTIYQIYSFLSDLGPHATEGNIVGSIVEHEETSIQDAFMGLRMTESILIWLYQNQEGNL